MERQAINKTIEGRTVEIVGSSSCLSLPGKKFKYTRGEMTTMEVVKIGKQRGERIKNNENSHDCKFAV
jgi:hypothetical protein